MQTTIVRYKVKPEFVEENEKLVRAVYDQIRQKSPDEFSYSTVKLEDGLSFIHWANFSEEGKSFLSGLSAFKEFQAGIRERCQEMPVVSHGIFIGSYQSRTALNPV
jgi:hypothetical protein